jgi:phosphatidylglycerophosphate synthase
MLDPILRPLVDRGLNPLGRWLASSGVTANQVTLAGGVFGALAALAVAFGQFDLALWLILINRFADGLDGAVARAGRHSDFGGYLDIVCDFIFYSAIPFAFGVADPANALAAAFLIFSFIGTASSFLAYAILAEKHHISTEVRGRKSFFHLGGLTEGSETILLLLAMVVWPSHFPYFAWGFGVLCWVTTGTRIHAAFRQFYD